MKKMHINPAYKGKQITICFATDTRYAPCMGVAIQSIICHSNDKKRYDICVLHSGISRTRIQQVKRMAQENVSIRFFCVDEMVKKERIEALYATPRFPKEACYRFFIPEFFRGKKKVLYMDCDVVVMRDVSELYDTCLGSDIYMGVVHDTFVRYSLANGDKYFKDNIRLKNPENYFQSGVLLLNLVSIKRGKVVEKLRRAMSHRKGLRFPDQDVLNIVCEKHVKYLDGRWNVEYHMPLCASNYREVMSPEEVVEYENNYADPWLLHFCGTKKPWMDPTCPHGDLFWEYARQTPFYEELLFRHIQENIRLEFKDMLKKYGF